jgi:hypothetical protein
MIQLSMRIKQRWGLAILINRIIRDPGIGLRCSNKIMVSLRQNMSLVHKKTTTGRLSVVVFSVPACSSLSSSAQIPRHRPKIQEQQPRLYFSDTR